MDQRQFNLVKSLFIAGISLALLLAFYSFVINPIEVQQFKEWREMCFDYVDGQWIEKQGISCNINHGGFFWIVLGTIPFLIFVASMNHFERKRLHTWRSYDK